MFSGGSCSSGGSPFQRVPRQTLSDAFGSFSLQQKLPKASNRLRAQVTDRAHAVQKCLICTNCSFYSQCRFCSLWNKTKKLVLLLKENPLLCRIKQFLERQMIYVNCKGGGSRFRLSKHWSVFKCWHFLWDNRKQKLIFRQRSVKKIDTFLVGHFLVVDSLWNQSQKKSSC